MHILIALAAEALMRRNRHLLKGWVTLGLNTKLKGYVYRQHLYTGSLGRQGNGSTTTIPLEVFTQRNFVADFIRLNLMLFTKTTNSLYEPFFGRVRGNLRTSSIAR